MNIEYPISKFDIGYWIFDIHLFTLLFPAQDHSHVRRRVCIY